MATLFLVLVVLSTSEAICYSAEAVTSRTACCFLPTLWRAAPMVMWRLRSNLAMFSTQIRQYDLQMERGWMELVPVAVASRDRPEPAVVFPGRQRRQPFSVAVARMGL